MTSEQDQAVPDEQDQAVPDERPAYADHCYRSGAGMAGGGLLLVLVALLSGDAMLRGGDREAWLAFSVLLFLAPLIFAFSLRPAVYAGRERLLVRNPFRTIALPWSAVENVRAGYSSEVRAGGRTYQLWAIPVSLRERKRALRQGDRVPTELRARADRAVEEIRGLAERHTADGAAQGEPTVRWAYEVLVPAVVGGVALLLLYLGG